MAFTKSLAFGPYRIVPSERLLLRGETPVPIGSRAFDILIALIENSGSLVTKDQLLAAAWPTTHVHEANLRVHIGGVRKLLGEGQAGARYIVSEAGRGYRFVAPVAISKEPTQQIFLPGYQSAAEFTSRTGGDSLWPIIGRSQVIASISENLSSKRFVTIVGPGGIGKTTVARAVANSRSPFLETSFVDLAPISEVGRVVGAFVSSLGLASRVQDPISDLLATLRSKDILIVVDTCEHVVEAAAPLIEDILDSAPHAQILATSREPLRSRGERVIRLAPLACPDAATRPSAAEALAYPAVQLFVERAGASHDGFEMSNDDAPIVARICRKLDGLPLAIELAASRIDAFGLKGMADLIDQHLQLPSLGRRAAPNRHRTLGAMLDWGYQTLPESERTILRRISIFPGRFTLDEAVAVSALSAIEMSETIESIANLVEKSLVAADLSGSQTHYRLLDTTRAYALHKLQTTNEFGLIARRHAEHCLTMFERTKAEREKAPAEWVRAYRHEIDNVRSALDWAFSPAGDAPLGVALTLAAFPLWTLLSLNEECAERAHVALTSLDPEDPAQAHARMRLSAALLGGAWAFTLSVTPHPTLPDALTLVERLGDVELQLQALWGSYADHYTKCETQAAWQFARRFASLALDSPIASDALIGERLIGYMHYVKGELDEARRRLEFMLARYEPHPSDLTRFAFNQRMLARGNLAKIQWLQGFPDRAERSLEICLNDREDNEHSISVIWVLLQSACQVAFFAGNLACAERYINMLVKLSAKHGPANWDYWLEGYRGLLMVNRGDLADGTQMLEHTLGRPRKASVQLQRMHFLRELAVGLSGLGRIEKARIAIEEALSLAREDESFWCLPELLRVRGEIARSAGARIEAEDYFQQSLDAARRQTALSWELRAAASLARLRQEQGRDAQAHSLLTPVYERFSEGFETEDLRIAQALLKELCETPAPQPTQPPGSGSI